MSRPNVLTATPLDGLRAHHIEFLLSIYLSRAARQHRCHRGAEGVFYLSSSRLSAVLGSHRYREIRDLLFECVDDRFSPDGLTRAYRVRPEAHAVFLHWARTLPKPTRPTVGTPGVYVVVIDLDALRRYATDHGCPVAHTLIRRAHDCGGGRGVLYERYRRTGKKGRRFLLHAGIQHAPSALRAVLLRGHLDVDVRNCHPELLNQETKGRYAGLAQYCRNRDAILERTALHYGCTLSEAKFLFLALTFGAALNGPTIRAWLEGKRTRRHSSEVFEYAHATQCAADDVVGIGPNRPSRLALYLQEIEDAVLTACELYHRARGETVSVLMFDGYMLVTDSVDALALSDWIYAATGYRLRFKVRKVEP
ncbi:MAG: hypothetical protein GY884_14290 [Proteobacteria bacterium]|nr:hypothetical protein [Pseudomonadota bacterium]